MTGAPRASVILPVHNAQDHVAHALRRLGAQDAADIEIVVVDDGSGDASAEIAREHARTDPRVRVLATGENVGVARARRLGVTEARGTWLWFVDVDDEWPDAALRLLLDAAGDGVGTVVADARMTFASGATRPIAAPRRAPATGAEALALLLRGDVTGHLWNKLFRRDVMARASFAPARVQSDLAMTADALSFSERVVFLPAEVYDYRIRGGSIITTPTARRESLAIVDDAVRRAAVRARLDGSDAHRYFEVRYIVLSGLKDAVLGPYEPAERAALVAAARDRLDSRALALLLRSRDPRRFALAASGRWSLPVYRRLLRAAERS